MKNLIGNLLERRVLQYLVLYIGVAWGLIQFTQLIVDVFLFSPHWTKVAIFAAFMLWPGYVFVVYRHARPGADHWDLADKLSVPVNLAIAAVALFFMFRGEDLGAATTSITIADETGALVEREVPKQEFRKRLVIFDFDADGLADEDLWVTGLVPEALYIEMLADDFLDPVSGSQFVEKLRRSGYPQLRNVPLALKRELAEEAHADWIVSGSIGKVGDNYTAVIGLHAAGDGKAVAESTYVADDLLALADRINTDLRQQLEVPDRDEVPDLPAREYFTSSKQALELYGRSRSFRLESDWPTATSLLQQAVAADSTFTLAQHTLATLQLYNNRRADAQAPIQAALTNVYRLPERVQFVVKADYYAITQDVEKAYAVVEMWSELYPEDVMALRNLYAVQTQRDQRVEAIATLEKIYALNSGMADVLKEIAQLHASLGNVAEARAALQRYVTRFPTDYTGLVNLAGIEMTVGDFAAARRLLDRALLLEPSNTELLVQSARLHQRVGEFAAAEAGLRTALATAATPAARGGVLGALYTFYWVQGQSTAALAALAQRFEEAEAFMLPIQLVALRLRNLDVYFLTGREAEVRAILDEYGPRLEGPNSVVARIAELDFALDRRDIAAADAQLAAVEALVAANQLATLRDSVLTSSARLAGLKGEWERALALRQEVLRANPTDVFVHTGIAECLRELGRLPEAETAIRTTIERLPGSASAYVELGRILQARGDAAGARSALERALAMWSEAEPDFEPAADARRLLAAAAGA